MYLIIEGRLADEDEIMAILAQPGGPARIKELIKSTAVACTIDHLHGYLLTEAKMLKAQLSEELLNDMCNIAWECLFKSNQKFLDDYVLAVARRIEEAGVCYPEPRETVH